ncbi:hypothetical protein BJ508DRAFT_374426 [Ascobolus immersus RN42]|uniref:Uncharacterized protein n=1 Tax=Ascobolus immersus RN42 TaxID=1160509 RepID=A0A3N4IIW5_ASCIM|nr:hypothetical protein BJ508DRAFT_374426 [Ascobolus immersus RN42]
MRSRQLSAGFGNLLAETVVGFRLGCRTARGPQGLDWWFGPEFGGCGGSFVSPISSPTTSPMSALGAEPRQEGPHLPRSPVTTASFGNAFPVQEKASEPPRHFSLPELLPFSIPENIFRLFNGFFFSTRRSAAITTSNCFFSILNITSPMFPPSESPSPGSSQHKAPHAIELEWPNCFPAWENQLLGSGVAIHPPDMYICSVPNWSVVVAKEPHLSAHSILLQ